MRGFPHYLQQSFNYMKVHIYRIMIDCNQNNYHSRSSTSSAAETFILIRKVHFCWTFCDLYPVSGSCFGHQQQKQKTFFRNSRTKIFIVRCGFGAIENCYFRIVFQFPALGQCYNKLSVSGFEFHRKVTNWQSFINEWAGRVTEHKGNLVHYSRFRKKASSGRFRSIEFSNRRGGILSGSESFMSYKHMFVVTASVGCLLHGQGEKRQMPPRRYSICLEIYHPRHDAVALRRSSLKYWNT